MNQKGKGCQNLNLNKILGNGTSQNWKPIRNVYLRAASSTLSAAYCATCPSHSLLLKQNDHKVLLTVSVDNNSDNTATHGFK